MPDLSRYQAHTILDHEKDHEDEIHFMKNFTLYDDLRAEFLHEPLDNVTDSDHYVSIFRNIHPKTLAIYIINAMNLRKL